MSPIGPSLPPVGAAAASRIDITAEQGNLSVFDFTFAVYSEGAGSISVRTGVGESAIDKVAADVLDRVLIR